MNTKTITMIIIGALLIGAGFFYGGIKYSENKDTSLQGGNFRGMIGQTRGQFNGSGATMRGNSIVAGEILSKDDNSITVKLTDGGSRLVFFMASTSVSRSTSGSLSDVATGEQVVVGGSSNKDGSFNARSIQIGTGFGGFR